MITDYTGTYKNIEELKAHNKQRHIEAYIKLSKRFNEKPSMELSSMMSDRFMELVNIFGMTPEEVEALETL